MNLFVYTVRDQAADAFLAPFFLHTDAIAVRYFRDCLRNEEHPFSKNPDDYTLFKIGSFDDSTGQYFPFEMESLGNGVVHLVPAMADTPIEHRDISLGAPENA